MTQKTEEYIDIYRKIANVPSVTAATIFPGQNENLLCIYSNWSSEDLVKLEKTSFSRDYIYNCEKRTVISAGLPNIISNICIQSFSKSGKKLAVIVKSTKNSNDYYDLEIWDEFKKIKTFELTDHEDHGNINTNGFSCLAWSSDENYLLYTAEAKQKKSSSYFKVSKVKEDKETKGTESIYNEEWGEDFVGSHHSVAVFLDINSSKTKVISVDKLYNELSIAEAIWGPDDKTVVFVGYKEFPQRLGIRSCINRSSAIYCYDCFSEEIKIISGEGNISVRSPRFSPDCTTLIYLENKVNGPHFKGSKLQKCDWETKKISTLVDIVNFVQSDEFPGLYVDFIPVQCWFKNYLFLSSTWRSFEKILCIDINDGTVKKVDPKISTHPDGTVDSFGVSSVLCVQKDLIVAQVSSPNIEPALVIGTITGENKISIDWKYLDSNAPVKHNDIEWQVIKMNEHKAELYYEVILMTPPVSVRKVKSQVIIWPHGGPHSCSTAGFSKFSTAFSKLNYILCFINYRGSSGFGEHSLNSLPGNIGKNDVADVQQAAEWVKSLPGTTIGDNFVVGGSHGGFLGAHLIGQYPNFYKAAVLWNPAIDLAGMAEATDIPDWVWVEGGCGDNFDPSAAFDPNHLKSAWERSPIKYVENVCVPVMFLLGSKDLRVPYTQGLKYYRILKARKIPVSAFVYEDGHALSKTPNNSDAFMQIALFLEKNSS